MRCPKCGYNSFDYLDSCKKCGKDLTDHKQRYGIVSVLFPGKVKPAAETAVAEGESVVEDVVAAATATAGAAAATTAAGAEDVAASASEGDDFGFDFMGDSDEEEDMSFDELFEEAPDDEEAEETLPSPEEEAKAQAEAVAGKQAAADRADLDFEFTGDSDEGDEPAFDDLFEDAPEDEDLEEALPSPDQEAEGERAEDDELASDFGFDPSEESDSGAEKDLDAEDFQLPPADKEEFSFDDDNVAFDDTEEEDSGDQEDPKSPFDLPESVQPEQAPENTDKQISAAETEVNDPFADDEPLLSRQLETIGTAAEAPAGSAAAVTEPGVAPFAEVQPAESAAPVAVATATEEPAGADLEQPDSTPESILGLPAIGKRMAAFLCDLCLLAFIGLGFLIAAQAAISNSGASWFPSLESLLDLSVYFFLVLFSLAFGYFTLFHFLAGQTPGKMMAGIRVETVSGDPLLLSQAFLRSVGGLLQLLPVGLGYLVILTSPQRRGWNDQLAGTRLVALSNLPEEGC